MGDPQRSHEATVQAKTPDTLTIATLAQTLFATTLPDACAITLVVQTLPSQSPWFFKLFPPPRRLTPRTRGLGSKQATCAAGCEPHAGPRTPRTPAGASSKQVALRAANRIPALTHHAHPPPAESKQAAPRAAATCRPMRLWSVSGRWLRTRGGYARSPSTSAVGAYRTSPVPWPR
eukprot:366036-Chlamydomonas_euryale.AAC.7